MQTYEQLFICIITYKLQLSIGMLHLFYFYDIFYKGDEDVKRWYKIIIIAFSFFLITVIASSPMLYANFYVYEYKNLSKNKQQFIEQIAVLVEKYAPSYDIKVYSPIIAQAILESAYGTSELAISANNFFGLKYRENRCNTCIGVYNKVGSEQNIDGSYSSYSMQWCQFENMEYGVIGYFDFTNIPNYANLKGVTDPYQYLFNIKADGYATSHKYVDNLMAVINKWDLTRYDPVFI